MKQIQISERGKTIIMSVITTLLVLFVIHSVSAMMHHGKYMQKGEMNHKMMSDKMDKDMGHMMKEGESMSMEQMMHDMNASLRGKTGAEFDKVFLEEMIIHHQGAVEMAELALESAGQQEIKDLSQEIIDAQEIEISQMKGWLEAWFK